MVSRIWSTSESVSWLTRRSGGMPTLSAISWAFREPMPWMYWSAITTRLLVGILTPAMRATCPSPCRRGRRAAAKRFLSRVRWSPALARLLVKQKSPGRLLAKPPGPSGVLLEAWHLMPRGRGVNPSGRREGATNRLRHLLDWTHAVDLDELSARLVIGRYHGGIAVVGCKPGLEDLRIVVLADRLAPGARFRGPALDPLDEGALVDLELEHRIEPQTLLREHRVEGFGLGDRARKSVEDEALPGVRPVDALGDDADHDVVRDEPARFHDRLGLEADRRTGSDRRAQHVAGRELRDAVARDEASGLRPLPRPRRPQKDDPHRSPRPLPSRALLGDGRPRPSPGAPRALDRLSRSRRVGPIGAARRAASPSSPSPRTGVRGDARGSAPRCPW